jgi:hypothetical protein
VRSPVLSDVNQAALAAVAASAALSFCISNVVPGNKNLVSKKSLSEIDQPGDFPAELVPSQALPHETTPLFSFVTPEKIRRHKIHQPQGFFMNRNNSLPIVIAGALLICLVAIFPKLFASLIGIGIIVVVAVFVLGGFIFLLRHWGVPWPVGVLAGVMLIGLVWRPAFGVVVGTGIVGGLFWLVYSVINRRDH